MTGLLWAGMTGRVWIGMGGGIHWNTQSRCVGRTLTVLRTYFERSVPNANALSGARLN